MIEYITGTLSENTPTYAVIEAAGVGYMINISLNTYTELQKAVQKNAKLLIQEVIREDAHTLFGFLTDRERTLFRLLMGVSGVGAMTARVILSSMSIAELEQTISSSDSKRLKAVKGIGAKTAERIIVELKDKIQVGDTDGILPISSTTDTYDETMAAMVALGFPKPAVQKVLNQLFKKEPNLGVEAAIKRALAMM